MEILRSIALYVEDKDLPFILIGGHAINAYGISRQTGDIDLLIRSNDANRWQELMTKLKYNTTQVDTKFIRYLSENIAAWPIDFMLVDNETFDKFQSESQFVEVGVANVRVVSRRHLVLLKLHALKVFLEHRFAKDFNDVLLLLKQKETGITAEELEPICLKYATSDLLEKIKREL